VLLEITKQFKIHNMKTDDRRVPADLRKVFAAAPKAKALWSDLTPLARDAKSSI
jgi:uncharacterized protein YdeI (YjbR/CyaY-like superfamily)